VTASARAFTSRRRGARCGARARLAGRIGFFTSTLLQAFAVFRKGLETITPFVAIECAGVGALVDHEHAVKIFFAASSGHAIFQGKSVSCCERAGFPI
jgi:hypothetical protein